jgi:FSR family fosmidomycin resistance protein-like MFS transporter
MGWYQVLQGEAYATVPGRSGTVMAIGSLAGLVGGALVWLVGWVAGQAGLQAAMWLLLLGPVSLALFTPTQ